MQEVVLLQKISNETMLKSVGSFLKESLSKLEVKVTHMDVLDGWVRIRVSGEDEKAAVHFLEKEIGLAPITIADFEPFSVYRGRIVLRARCKEGIFVDFGMLSPQPVNAIVTLERLRGQLVDGEAFPLSKIAKAFSLISGFPLQIRVVKADGSHVEAELTEKQLDLFSCWIDSRVDRLVVMGALAGRVNAALGNLGLERDVVGTECLGVLEHVAICKLGTDAAGLMPRLGRELPWTSLGVFSPRRVFALFGRPWDRA